LELGLAPHLLSDTLLSSMFGIIDRHRDRVNTEALLPGVRWRDTAVAARGPAGERPAARLRISDDGGSQPAVWGA
jgi:hypothetical protein